jgi:hypothetical protein
MMWRGIECAKDSGCDWKEEARGVITAGKEWAGQRQLMTEGSAQAESGISVWSWLMMIVMALPCCRQWYGPCNSIGIQREFLI